MSIECKMLNKPIQVLLKLSFFLELFLFISQMVLFYYSCHFRCGILLLLNLVKNFIFCEHTCFFTIFWLRMGEGIGFILEFLSNFFYYMYKFYTFLFYTIYLFVVFISICINHLKLSFSYMLCCYFSIYLFLYFILCIYSSTINV